jgi:hypothetical protein
MLRKIVGSVNFYLAATVHIVYEIDMLKGRIKKLAETETVNSAREYVIVRAARGDYFKPGGVETMKFDYEFYRIITNPQNGKPRP